MRTGSVHTHTCGAAALVLDPPGYVVPLHDLDVGGLTELLGGELDRVTCEAGHTRADPGGGHHHRGRSGEVLSPGNSSGLTSWRAD
jgi:hypothetical protein